MSNCWAGTIIQGTPYVAVYNNSDGAFYLQGFYGNAYNIPLGGLLPFTCPTAPNSSFVFPYGQAISRTVYAAYFALVGTSYGSGDGSTTFNVIDLRGRTIAGKDDMGGSAANRLTNAGSGIVGTTLGASGGAETQTLTLAQLPTGITAANASQAISVSTTISTVMYGANVQSNNGTGGARTVGYEPFSGSMASTGNNSISVTSNNTSGAAHPILQPTITCNLLLRII
jgi:microcystin-dependent protein